MLLTGLLQKLRVWCRPRNDQWELAKIKSTVGDEASVMLLDGSVSLLIN